MESLLQLVRGLDVQEDVFMGLFVGPSFVGSDRALGHDKLLRF